MAENDVILITTDRCYGCDLMKKFLSKHSVPFREVAGNSPEGQELIRKHGARTAPTGILPDGTVIAGFHPARYSKLLNLD